MSREGDGTELLRRHLPVLRYDSQGSFLADSPAILTNRVSPEGHANELKRADGSLLATAAGGRRRARLELDFLGRPNYSDGGRAARSDYLDALGRDYVVQAREMHRGAFADRIYGHARPADGGGWWLQYWFFYLFNNKAFLGIGLHEGDWEMVQLRIGGDGRPSEMAFAQHAHGQRCSWALVEKRGARPIVYVARGSQASYASAGRHDAPIVPDFADGKGREVAQATLDVIDDERPSWVAWPGRWGSTRARTKLESNSPRGPAHQDKWHDPDTFHAECDEIGLPGLAPEPPTAGPASPEISVRREGERAVIAYRLRPSAAGHAPVQLLLTLDSSDDAQPPATYARPVAADAGELEHPLPLDAGPYSVLVSAADEHGHVSDPATTRLE